MKKNSWVIAVLFQAVCLVSFASDPDPKKDANNDAAKALLILPEKIVYKETPNPGITSAVLYGNPKEAGIFIVRVKFAKGTKDVPHYHNDSFRTGTVMQGTLYFGTGTKFDEANLVSYPAGTFYSEPPGSPHYTWAKDEDVILQIVAMGPTSKFNAK